MPKSAAHDTISRQWELLKLLPRRPPGLTCAELCSRLADNGYRVTKRTVERDLPELVARFAVTCNEAYPRRWHWLEGASTDLVGPDLPEALGLVLAEQTVRPLLPAAVLAALQPRFDLARAKLASLDHNALARWTEKVRSVPAALQLLPPSGSGDLRAAVLADVQQALLDETLLEVDYASPAASIKRALPLHPLGLVQRGPVAYLVASAYDYDEPRLYALHRMSRVRRLAEPRRAPAGFTLDGYLAAGHLDFDPGEEIRLEARVGDHLAQLLEETKLSTDQKITGQPGDYRLAATVRDSWQLRFWLLSQGPEITVLSPPDLRAAIRASLDQARVTYL